MRFTLATIFLISTLPALAAWKPVTLLDEESMANDLCRGGAGSSTDKACDLRDMLVSDLKRVGWCYGRPGEVGAQMTWHECGR